MGSISQLRTLAYFGSRSLARRTWSSAFEKSCTLNHLNLAAMSAPVAANSYQKRWSSHGNHAPMWTMERILSGALIAMVPASFAASVPLADYVLATALVVHVHWGLEAIVVDYIRPSIFGNVIPKISLVLLYVLSALSLGGLFYFNLNDCGLVTGIRMAWKKL